MGYLYDADGNRIAKGTIQLVNGQLSCDTTKNGFNPTESYILGPGGQQLTEMTWSGGVASWGHTNVWAAGALIATYSSPNGSQTVLNFHFTDWLGTRRILTDYAGNVTQTCRSLPFGNGETCPTTPTEHLFTQKERDAETGNDYFGARYYSSLAGRFLTPDWSAKAEPVPYAKMDNPQSLNLYAYVDNNPLSRIDADGHFGLPGILSSLWAAITENEGGTNLTGTEEFASVNFGGTEAQQQNNGPFLAKNPGKYMGKTCGSGQCVDFVKADTEVPRTTKDWAPGTKVGAKTPEGAAIATFGASGKYENKVGQSHAAELVSVSPNGKSAVIRDQWKGQEVHTRTIYDRGGKGLPVNDLSRYSVIMRKEDQ